MIIGVWKLKEKKDDGLIMQCLNCGGVFKKTEKEISDLRIKPLNCKHCLEFVPKWKQEKGMKKKAS